MAFSSALGFDAAGNVHVVGLGGTEEAQAFVHKYGPDGALSWMRTVEDVERWGGLAVVGEDDVYYASSTRASPPGEVNAGERRHPPVHLCGEG